MLVTEQERQRQEIVEMVANNERDRSSLLPVLQEIQKKYFCISDFAMQVVADQYGIHPVEVYSVVTFYSFFNEKPAGKYVFRLCSTISCDMLGKESVARQLVNDLGIGFGETTRDGRFSLEWASCLGMCDQGPALLVNDYIYTRVTPMVVHDIIEICRNAFGVFPKEQIKEAIQ